jgi:ATP-binding cassette, subfamily B, multidrug efflux pump
LHVAAADDFVRAHPDGLQMRVAQGGINFSGGQRQRLAIARAVIRRPAIYVFDDAFSALDVHTDALVRSRLAEITPDATVIVVAQRISTIIDADQVIVIEDGRMVGAGTHEFLMEDSPTYREFAESQSLDAEVGGAR